MIKLRFWKRKKNYMKSGEVRQGDSLHFDGKGFYTKGTGKPEAPTGGNSDG